MKYLLMLNPISEELKDLRFYTLDDRGWKWGDDLDKAVRLHEDTLLPAIASVLKVSNLRDYTLVIQKVGV